MCTIVRMLFNISMIGFQHITGKSGVASEILALFAKKPCNQVKEDESYNLVLPTVQPMADLMIFLHCINKSVNLNQPGQVSSFAWCLSLALLSKYYGRKPFRIHASCKAAREFWAWEINTYLSCIGGSCIQLLNRGSYRLTKFVLCFPVKIYLRHLKLRFLCGFAYLTIFYKLSLLRFNKQMS